MQVRELDNRFHEACNTTALLSLEKYGLDGADLDALPEEARTLLQDKDILLNAVQVSASHAARWPRKTIGGCFEHTTSTACTLHAINVPAPLQGRSQEGCLAVGDMCMICAQQMSVKHLGAD